MRFFACISFSIIFVLLLARTADAIAETSLLACNGPNNSDHHEGSSCKYYGVSGQTDPEDDKVVYEGTCVKAYPDAPAGGDYASAILCGDSHIEDSNNNRKRMVEVEDVVPKKKRMVRVRRSAID
ncbi:hypothetical protein C8R42DRAFT_19898 [Lentinula raphanica]|nr:hypothetical protein C8R42DRAFT_19898 [Lentinula raphanica]KAJ3827031.1 hypothetical protein F5880DRAFT_1313246 [Lentinula raphanica]